MPGASRGAAARQKGLVRRQYAPLDSAHLVNLRSMTGRRLRPPARVSVGGMCGHVHQGC